METTMLIGEHFFADKCTYLFSQPKQGHVIAFNNPLFHYSNNRLMRLFQEYVWGPVNLTKRVIGVPGDVIEGKIEDGKPVIYRNGTKLIEPYLNKYPLISLWESAPDHHIAKRSYDPSLPFDKQNFYHINKALIVKNTDGSPIIEMPGTLIREPKVGNTDVFHVTLGENQFWLMGDNRLNSGDSRIFGPVERRLIHGRIIVRLWSIDSTSSWIILDLIKHPLDFWSRVRWHRFFQWVY
jgi:signal peptidase I